MSFNILAFIYTFGCCLLSMIIAGISASKKGNKEWFENLNHPKYEFMLKYMNKVGLFFYLLFGFVLYNLFVSKDVIPIFITISIILLMGLCPFLLYRTKNLKLFFYANLLFFIPIPILISLLIKANLLLAILVIVYFLYFIYDISYFFRLMKLNK